MRKKILTIAAVLFVSFAAAAQPPVPPAVGDNAVIDSEGNKNNTQAPVAPATLLLLGLAGGVAGIKLYRNSKSND